jgi:hypothetical protein
VSDDVPRADPSIGELQRDLGRVEGKIDGILAGISNILTDNIACHTDRASLRQDLSARIAKVENRQWYIAGAAAAVVVGVRFLHIV